MCDIESNAGLTDDRLPDLRVVQRILQLKKERRAVILAHNYQSPEIQFVADYVGDTLSLSLLARDAEQAVIVFCGPDFMVETAKILAPNKTILYANENAICPMAAMITREDLIALKQLHPKAKVVGYVNTSPECKCEMDICCASANAVKIVRSLDSEEVIFVPDRNLGSYVRRMVPEKTVLTWSGFCSVHNMIHKEEVLALARAHPHARIIVHPECRPEVVDLADMVLSTESMIMFAANSSDRESIVLTELEVVNRMIEDNPDKEFYAVERAYCRTQKKVKLENVLKTLETLAPEVSLPSDVLERARLPIDRMLAVGRADLATASCEE
ncbi:MAG: quinolinate synthase NadA [Candidatus Marsarchaeota archaeon]|nr:quinolinate synthase NadA [Candidatus Marsarchaeota archaeon]